MKRVGATQCLVHPEDAERIGAADDHRRRVAARCHRRAQFLLDHRDLGDAARLVGALLLVLALLVLDENAADAEALVEFDRPHDALHVAVAVVTVGEKGQGRCRRDVADAVDHVGHADEADVRQAVTRGEHGGAADRERTEAGAGDQARRQSVVRERGHQRAFRSERVAQRDSSQSTSSRARRGQLFFDAGAYAPGNAGR